MTETASWLGKEKNNNRFPLCVGVQFGGSQSNHRKLVRQVTQSKSQTHGEQEEASSTGGDKKGSDEIN